MYKCQSNRCNVQSREINDFSKYNGKKYCNTLTHWPRSKTCYEIAIESAAKK